MSAVPIESRGALMLLAAVDSCTISVGNLMPILIGLLIDEKNASIVEAGAAASLEQAGYIAGILSYRALRGWLATRSIVLIALGTMILASGLTVLLPLPVLFAARILFGAGVGVILALVYAIVSLRPAPQRDYATLAFVTLTSSAALLVAASYVAQWGGLLAFCAMTAILALLAGLLAAWLPHVPTTTALATGGSASRLSPAVLALAAAAFLNYLAHSALWAFQAKMAEIARVDPASTGLLLGLSSLGGVAGALLALGWGARAGFRVPQGVAGAILFLAAAAIAGSIGTPSLPWLFAAAVIVIKIGWFLGYPYLQGAASLSDRTGRAATIAGGAQLAGAMIGPVLGAVLASRDYAYIAVLAAACYLLGTALAMPAAREAERRCD